MCVYTQIKGESRIMMYVQKIECNSGILRKDTNRAKNNLSVW